MKAHFSLALFALLLLVWSVSFALQRGGGPRYFSRDDNPAPVPVDWQEKAEFARARLVYSNYGGRSRGYGGGGSWTTDYPKSDRIFLQGVRRLTRIQTQSIEQVVGLDNDEIFQVPFVYAVEVGHWGLTDPQAQKLREFLLRGGFLMVDDFHGSLEWEVFMQSMSRVFPDRPVVDLANTEEIFHVLYDVDERVQVPGLAALNRGVTFEQDGFIRQGADHGGHLPQHGLGRRLGMGRLGRLSGTICHPGLSGRHQLHRLFDDALRLASDSVTNP
jgi:hypothetical protein